MNELTPTQAALIARGVYGLRESTVSGVYDRGQTLGCEDMFVVDDSSRFQGRSGSLAWKRLSGFGYIAEGYGKYQGDALLVTRGTDMRPDWLTNFNIGMQIGPGGDLVHAGFNDTWKSFRQDVQDFIKGRNLTTIHCVGHSLGGALAALNADYLSAAGVGQVKLYTFGAPRAGSFMFAKALTQRVGSTNIHRVSHPSDLVPMIPLFPFQHLPNNELGLVIDNDIDGLISIAAHNMLGSYIPGVANKVWDDLKVPANPNSDAQVRAWLEHSAGTGGGFMMGSTKLLGMIGRALLWILKKCGEILVGALGTALTIGATVLDQMAWLIGKGLEFSVEVAGYVKHLISAIFKFLGRVVSATVSLTIDFLRWVLDLLFMSLSTMAAAAIMPFI